MQRLTRQELQTENEVLRSKLEMAQRIISDALGYEDEEEEEDVDQDEDEETDQD
jgi:hypothetical protein